MKILGSDDATSSQGEREGGSSPEQHHKIGHLLADELSKGRDELIKAKLKFEHSLGLGRQPNVIPPAPPNILGEERLVRIGWHPVLGLAGKWFAEKTGLGKLITEKIHQYPDPTQHWGVLVGDYAHQLWMDEELTVIYLNEEVSQQDWHTFEVGKTRFNDEALRRAGEMVIYNMREKEKEYNLISNNCQTFAVALLDAIHIGRHQEFATSYAVYKAATIGGFNAAEELFSGNPPEEVKEEKLPEGQHYDILKHAHELMDKYTTKLDNHHTLF